jgi:hypothetical protein
MRYKQNLILAFLINAFLLGACNLAVVTPTSTPAPFSPTPVVTGTATPFLTLTPIFFPSATPTQPTATLTLFFAPTATATPSWESCPLIITRNDTSAGDVLHIRQCDENLEYDLGPFAKGAYAVSPNMKFIVYVTDNGMLYAAKFGSEYLSVIANLEKERFFVGVNKRVPVQFLLTFTGEAPYYKLVLFEKKFAQKKIYDIPIKLQE